MSSYTYTVKQMVDFTDKCWEEYKSNFESNNYSLKTHHRFAHIRKTGKLVGMLEACKHCRISGDITFKFHDIIGDENVDSVTIDSPVLTSTEKQEISDHVNEIINILE